MQAGRQAGKQANKADLQTGKQANKADRQTGKQSRQAERQTGRQANIQTGKQVHRQTGRKAKFSSVNSNPLKFLVLFFATENRYIYAGLSSCKYCIRE